VAPAIVVKWSSQYWFDRVSYARRMSACAVLMALSFVLVAFGARVPTKLLGVVCCSLQSALGEASSLALTSRFPRSERRLLLTGWSSGTGIAGIAGYVWVAVFLHVLGASFGAMLASALLVLPAAWTFLYHFRIHGSFRDDVCRDERKHVGDGDGDDNDNDNDNDDGNDKDLDQEAIGRRYALEQHHDTSSLLPYSLPLFLVYFAEYACQSGVWITIGFPPDSEEARKRFYSASNIAYQVGVFLSRSSGAVFELAVSQLPWLAAFQFGLLFFFVVVSALKVLYGWWLLAPAFVTGIFGGLTYVNAFRLLGGDSHPAVRERNLALTSTADSLGVACADLIGVALQRVLA